MLVQGYGSPSGVGAIFSNYGNLTVTEVSESQFVIKNYGNVIIGSTMSIINLINDNGTTIVNQGDLHVNMPTLGGNIINKNGGIYFRNAILNNVTIATSKLVLEGNCTINCPINIPFSADDNSVVTVNSSYIVNTSIFEISGFTVKFNGATFINSLTLKVRKYRETEVHFVG